VIFSPPGGGVGVCDMEPPIQGHAASA